MQNGMALTSARFARADEWRYEKPVYWATIEDDGIGLLASSTDPVPAGTRRGLGLLGMRERATLIGGDLDITSTPGKGTTVRLLLP